ncbi:MAG: hypothetical protein MJ237_05930, partial [bacterium]|nr:hypothetical protein [bacterium]
MEQSNFWLQFNNGKKINLSEIHDGINIDENNEFLKKYDKNSNSIFDKDEIEKLKEDAASYLADGVLDKREMVSWFAKLFGFSVESLKTDNEAKNRSMSDISDLVENSINDIANRSAQADCVEYLKSNSLNMTTDMLTRDNGIITELYDKIKNKCDDSLSPNYIYSIIFSEVLSAQFLEEANNGELTKQDYIERKINAAKAMMMHKIMGEYFESEFADLDVPREQLEKVIRQYLDFNLPHLVEYAAYNYDSEQGNVYDGISWGVNNLVERILKDEEFEKKFFKNISCSIIQDISKITSSGNSATVDKQGYDLSQVSIIPHVNYGEDELLNFEQTFKLEKGMDFNSEAYQEFQEAKSEMERVMAPFNKMSIMNSQIEDVREDLQKSIACNPHSAAFDKVTDAMDKSGDVPKAEDKIQKICNLFNEYYANNAEQAANDLNNIIQSKKIYGLRIGIAGNNLNISFTKQLNTDSDKLYALIQVLDAFEETMARRFESILGGKSLESYMNDYNSKQKNALGNTNMETLIDAYKADNGTVVQKYTGAVKTTGMVATFVGGVLCLSPAAGVGVGLVTAGGKMAIGGMAADYALEYTEALTRDEISKEELEDITKYCLMDAGGFIVGFKAGQKGNQAFAKLLDKKLASVLKQEITAGNRIKALKTVLSQKTLLKNFMSAEGAKMGTDFFISYVGDLVMMGVLDTDDNWESLLKQNLLGIVIGSSNDLADVGKLTVASQQRYRELKQKQNKSILNDAELKELAALEKEHVNGKTKENTEQQIEADNKPDGQKPQIGLVDETQGKSTRKADVSGKTEISVDKIQIKELTDEEFNVIKEKLFSKMEEIEPLKKIDKNEVNKYNCQILEYITEHPELLENKNFADNVGN